MIQHFRMLAGYNAWANLRLFAAAAQLPDAEYHADRGAFFKSVHGTLNHLLATDRIWMKRFTGVGDAPARLDVVLFDTLPELRAAREREDQRIQAYVEALTSEALAHDLLPPGFEARSVRAAACPRPEPPIQSPDPSPGAGPRSADRSRRAGPRTRPSRISAERGTRRAGGAALIRKAHLRVPRLRRRNRGPIDPVRRRLRSAPHA